MWHFVIYQYTDFTSQLPITMDRCRLIYYPDLISCQLSVVLTEFISSKLQTVSQTKNVLECQGRKLNEITFSNKRKNFFFFFWGALGRGGIQFQNTQQNKKGLKIRFTNDDSRYKKSELYFILFSFAMLVIACTWLTNSCFARSDFTKLSTFLCSTNENSRSKTDLRENIFLLQDDKYNHKHTFF